MIDRRQDIQGLRAVAVLLVVAYHCGLPVSGGFVGVDVFFVISGFVITRLLLREADEDGNINLRRFYTRRVRRLLPALALLIVVVLPVTAVVQSPLGSMQVAARTAAAAALFVSNAVLFLEPSGYFAAPAAMNPFLHTWSLAVEEQFYLIFPGVMVLAAYVATRRRASRRRVTFALLLVLSALSFLLAMHLTTTDGFPFHAHNAAFSFYSSPTRAWEFGMGALIALGEGRIQRWGRRAALPVAVLGAAGVTWAAVAITAADPFPGFNALIPVVGSGLLIIAGSISSRQPISWVLSSVPMQWIGDLSYSWYLWHWPVIVFANNVLSTEYHWLLPCAGVLSLLPAWLSKRYVEDPIRTGRKLADLRASRLVAVSVGLAVIVSAVTFGAAQIATPEIRDARAQRAAHLDVGRGCIGNMPDEERTRLRCLWPEGGEVNARSVVLIGDSNAGQFAEALIPAATQQNRTTILATNAACPFVELVLDPAPPGCIDFVERWLRALADVRPGLVVIASASSDYFLADQHVRFRLPHAEEWTEDDAGKGRLWQQGIAAVLQKLAVAHVPVVVVHTLPHFVNWDLYKCPGYEVWVSPSRCGRSTGLAETQRQQNTATLAERRAANGLLGVSTVDLGPTICPDGVCRTNDGSRWVARDGGHITVGEAQRLQSEFTRLIAEHARS
ncbi:acyltransferase family protein [Mycobacterium sp. NPDC050853]|uniref:acyltransferase family protein n=1 Tax=Mycobacterium sp. NPDC050853 TaxID=3155160 RepID=UPI0033E57C8B